MFNVTPIKPFFRPYTNFQHKQVSQNYHNLHNINLYISLPGFHRGGLSGGARQSKREPRRRVTIIVDVALQERQIEAHVQQDVSPVQDVQVVHVARGKVRLHVQRRVDLAGGILVGNRLELNGWMNMQF